MSNVADVYDMSSVVSLNPLAFGLTSTFVVGPKAIMQRVLGRWCTLVGSEPGAPDVGVPIPLLDADGTTLAASDLRGLRGTLEQQALAEDFVTGAVVRVSLTESGLLTVVAELTLTDGITYTLEVTAAGAINELGGTHYTDGQIALIVQIFQSQGFN